MSSLRTKPGNSERGWNDPPVFIYGSGGSTNLSSSRNILSKRVAFPQNTSYPQLPTQNNFHETPFYNQAADYRQHSEPATLLPREPALQQNVHLMPPSNFAGPPSYHGPVIVPTMPVGSHSPHLSRSATEPYSLNVLRPTASEISKVATDPMSELPVAAVLDDSELQVPNFSDDEQMYHYCVTRLQRALNECQGTTERRVLDEMQKKLNVFSDMWKAGRISYVIQYTMAKLATAIHRRKFSVANELHLVLMVDHISAVSRWLVGIKKLIQEIEKVPQQPTSPSASCSYDSNAEIPPEVQTQALDPPCQHLPSLDDAIPLQSPLVSEGSNRHIQVLQEQQNRLNSTVGDFVGVDPPQYSCSPPLYDPEKIAQCFNGHGELMMKFVQEDNSPRDSTGRSIFPTTRENFQTLDSTSAGRGFERMEEMSSAQSGNDTMAESDSASEVDRDLEPELTTNGDSSLPEVASSLVAEGSS